MLRRSLAILALLAAAIAVLLCAMQVRSYWRRDFFKERGHESYATSESGRLVLILYGWPGVPRWASATIVRPREYVDQELARTAVSWQRGWHADWGVAVAMPRDPQAPWIVIAPHALLALAILLVPLAAWRLCVVHDRRSRRRAGRCVVCGYDLRASPDRCPECGAMSTPGATA